MTAPGFPALLSSGRPYYDLPMFTAQLDEVCGAQASPQVDACPMSFKPPIAGFALGSDVLDFGALHFVV